MTAPFVYLPLPQVSPTLPYNPYYAAPQNTISPFVPPSSRFQASPYLVQPATAASPISSPGDFNPRSVLWPEGAFEAAYTTPSPRLTTFWQGIPVSCLRLPPTPRLSTTAPTQVATVPVPPLDLPPATTAPTQTPSASSAPEQIHPRLAGTAPSSTFFYDLSYSRFLPQRIFHPLPPPHPPQYAMLSSRDFNEPAFHPPRTKLRLLFSRLPFWPVDLALPEAMPEHVNIPISVGDVLVALHHALHARISATDYWTLGETDRRAVRDAFAQRCRAEAVRSGVPPTQLYDVEKREKAQGLRKVDFLCGKTVFTGLVKA
ncbi:hypothetical protein FB45DRAFT_788608, partial [Roridomyces roridus]